MGKDGCDVMEFEAYNKIPRLKRGCVITEKIDGTNAQIAVTEDGRVLAGSRARWITPGKETDNFGFAAWVEDNRDELIKLGPGRHFGEWWGAGIQRTYGLSEKRFSLFNAGRWGNPESGRPACCGVVPVLFAGDFATDVVDEWVAKLAASGSYAQPGFSRPEGVVVYMPASGHLYKVLCENDHAPKSKAMQ
jgi:hypothetical protein